MPRSFHTLKCATQISGSGLGGSRTRLALLFLYSSPPLHMTDKRGTAAYKANDCWNWAGKVARTVQEITPDFRLRACGLAAANNSPLCRNQYADHILIDGEVEKEGSVRGKKRRKLESKAKSEDDATEVHECSKKACKTNPHCLNWLGQEDWEDEGWLFR